MLFYTMKWAIYNLYLLDILFIYLGNTRNKLLICALLLDLSVNAIYLILHILFCFVCLN